MDISYSKFKCTSDNMARTMWRWPLSIRLHFFEKVESAINRINLYPVDSAIGFPSNTYPLVRDLLRWIALSSVLTTRARWPVNV